MEILTSDQQMKELGVGSVVEDRYGDVWQLRGSYWCAFETAPHQAGQMIRFAPFELLKRVDR